LNAEPARRLAGEAVLYRITKRLYNLIIIAHRLSTIKSADQITVFDKAMVVESGRHGDLIHEDSWYADMVEMQAMN